MLCEEILEVAFWTGECADVQKATFCICYIVVFLCLLSASI